MDALRSPLIDGLMNPAVYSHPCRRVELVETHISWVLLTGLRVYKIKKPVNLGFVDFTTLDRRRYFCEEELRLNRRLAPDLYLDVVAITGTNDNPRIGGDGPVLEYAVCMLQFDQRRLLSSIPLNELSGAQTDNLADQCAEFHRHAAVADPNSQFGSTQHITKPVRDNFQVLRNADESMCELVRTLEEHAELQCSRLSPIFENRRQNGMIRECHGDLHLGNMFLQEDRVTVFDGIEFSEDLRWIDIISDIAFAVMDFADRGYQNHSNRLLNRWLERTGDYSGLSVLPFYCAYRAVVRAKIDTIRMHQPNLSFSGQRHLVNDCQGYLNLAQSYTVRHCPAVLITMGPSGSGKTTTTQRLIETSDTIRIRSDVERKRMYGLSPEEHATPEQKARMYSSEATDAIYDRLAELSAQVIDAGFPVVVDATFLKRLERERFSRLADSLGVPFLIIRCEAPKNTLKERIRQRSQRNSDASEADEMVLESQLHTAEELDSREARIAVDGAAENLSLAVRSHVERNG